LCYQARSIVQIFSYHFPIIFLSFSSLLKSTACPKRTSLCCPADSAPSLLLLQLSQALHAVLPELWPALASRMVDDTPTIDHCWWSGRGRYKLPNGFSIVSFSTRTHTRTHTHAHNINIYYCIYMIIKHTCIIYASSMHHLCTQSHTFIQYINAVCSITINTH
jgi:hypothetical protein